MTEKTFEEVCVIRVGRFDAMGVKNTASQKELGITNSSIDCYLSVRQLQPDANGMTWVKEGSHNCWAAFNATYIREEGCKPEIICETCIFGGK